MLFLVSHNYVGHCPLSGVYLNTQNISRTGSTPLFGQLVVITE